jgi:peptide/nickel transport system substrate-binding protein
MTQRRYFLIMLMLLIFPVLVISNLSAAEIAKDSLMICREQGANSLDIHGIGANRPAYGLSWNVYDRLMTYGTTKHPNGSLMYDYKTLKPELAESWEIAPDGMSVTFKIRKNAKFHDGTPVTAEDVKWSFDRAVTVGGFPTFQMKAGSLEKPEQFIIVDDYTFKVQFLRKDKLTMPDLAVPVAAIYNSKLAKKNATEKDPWAMEWLKHNTAAGGAYKIKAYESGIQTQYERNDAWINGPLPKIKNIIERVVPSASTRRALLERGDVDVSFDLPPKDFAELAKMSKLTVIGLPVENFMFYVDMNVTKPPFDNLKVRQAISYAIPYERISSAVTFGRARKLFGGPSSTPAKAEWPQPSPYKTDLEKAKKLLAEAGFPGGFKTPLYFSLGWATWGEPTALLIQENLKKIGIEVTIEKIPGANWRSMEVTKSMPFLINEMGGWLNYPEYFFFWNYHSQNAVFNTMSYQNKDMDKYIDGARFTTDPKEHDQFVKAFIQKAFEDAPRIPLFQSNLDVAMQKNVHGYHYWFHRQVDYRQIYKN